MKHSTCLFRVYDNIKVKLLINYLRRFKNLEALLFLQQFEIQKPK